MVHFGGRQRNAAASRARSLLFAGCLALALGWSGADAADGPDFDEITEQAEGGLREIVERYSEDRGSLDRFYDLGISGARLDRIRDFYDSWDSGLETLPFDGLDLQSQIDYLLLENQIDFELRRVDLERSRVNEVLPIVPFAPTIIELHDKRRRRDGVVAEQTASLLTELASDIEELQKAFDAQLNPKPGEGTASAESSPGSAAPDEPELPGITAVKKTTVNRAADTVDRLRDTLREWFDYHHGYDPLFTWWVSEPHKQLDGRLAGYAQFLREKVVGLEEGDTETVIGDPIGREALLVELRNEMIPYTPEELIEIARQEFAWCDKEMLRASREMGYGDDWRKALEHVKSLHVPPGEQPALIRKQAEEAVEFMKEFGLVTVPALAEETWRMRMMSPERQLINPFFTGGEVISISFPTDGMTHEQKLMSMRGNNIHFSRATVHHELIPGHHLQQFMNSRYRPYRREFRTPFWTEGWAFYWEMVLWDKNFPKTPENRIGMLFWRMHRCARIIFSLSFHLGKMTAQECIDFLVDRVGHERANAAAEVRRSFTTDYPPLYQCAYMLGALQFRSLRRELVDSGKMAEKDFHDSILRLGPMPVEMVRVALRGESPARDFVSSWRFYD